MDIPTQELSNAGSWVSSTLMVIGGVTQIMGAITAIYGIAKNINLRGRLAILAGSINELQKSQLKKPMKKSDEVVVVEEEPLSNQQAVPVDLEEEDFINPPEGKEKSYAQKEAEEAVKEAQEASEKEFLSLIIQCVSESILRVVAAISIICIGIALIAIGGVFFNLA